MHSISFIFAKSRLGLLTSRELVVLCLVHSCHLSHLFTINLGILSLCSLDPMSLSLLEEHVFQKTSEKGAMECNFLRS